VAVLNRVRKALDRAHLAHQNNAAGSKHAPLSARIQSLERDVTSDRGKNAAVLVAGTGRAVEKVLKVASWFEQERDCLVEVRTKTVGTVDDVVVEGDDDDQEEEESRIRHLSSLEVVVRLK
jgi:ribonuclease P/MRP protein subunit POP7